MQVASVLYMSWLTWKIARASAPGEGDAVGSPITFLQAAAFQWVNPKAWAMALAAVTFYAPDRSVGAIVMVACVFGALNLPSVSAWTVLGTGLRHMLRTPERLTLFNWSMAALLVASMYPVLKI